MVLDRRWQKRAGAVVMRVTAWDALGVECVLCTRNGNIAALGKHTRIENVCGAEIVFTGRFVNMARYTDMRLICFDELSDTGAPHVLA